MEDHQKCSKLSLIKQPQWILEVFLIEIIAVCKPFHFIMNYNEKEADMNYIEFAENERLVNDCPLG